MKKEKFILFSLISSILISTGFIEKKNKVEDKSRSTFTSHEVEFKFIGNAALYGTPKDCGILSPDTVVLKGILSGEERVVKDDFVTYRGVLQLSIKMAVCNVIRKNGEDRWCTMSVNGNGPVKTELNLDTANHEGYGYITVEYEPSLGKFEHHVNGTCDTHEMLEEEDNVPNNSIATIFNGYELRGLKKVAKLQRGNYPADTGPGGTTYIEVKY